MQILMHLQILMQMQFLLRKNEQTIDILSRKNIGLLSKSQLNKNLSNITGVSDKKGPKRNRNGKQGIDKKKLL